MARVKLSEYTAKTLLYPALKLKFNGFSATPQTTAKDLRAHFGSTNLVLKVDQGIKKRGKLGLVKLNLTPQDIPPLIKTWSKQGWSHFLVEPVIEHSSAVEHYLSLELTRHGWHFSYLEKGGIDVESFWDQPQPPLDPALSRYLHAKLIPALEQFHLVFLEMNPVLIRGNNLIPLDMAAEIDSAALSLPELAPLNLIPVPDRAQSAVEKAIADLDASTPASLKFHLLNPRGSIWMLLSGGGASLVLADEVADQKLGSELANYGEYSGAPGDDDVYAYTKLILTELLRSSAAKKALIIAGGVANFTDIAVTFKGLIRALKEQSALLKKARVKVFVRRGGPNEKQGLKLMQDFLHSAGLFGSVHGHQTPLTQVVKEAKDYLS